MKLADDTVNIRGLQPVMRRAMRVAERLWIAEGRPEGITITAGLNGVHSAASWHYCGGAVDIRTQYYGRAGYDPDAIVWKEKQIKKIHAKLKAQLYDYDIILHSTHIHMEPGDDLARKYGILI